jgi:hypothetical protein
MTSQTIPGKKISATVRYGAIASVGMILVTVGTYKAGPATFVDPMINLMYLIPMTCGVMAAITERRRQGGFLDFRSALRVIFGILVVATALQGLFTWLLLNVFEPRSGQAVRSAWLANAIATYRRFGITGDELDKNIALLKESDPFSIGSVLFGLAKFYIVGFPVSVILAVIVRHKKP